MLGRSELNIWELVVGSEAGRSSVWTVKGNAKAAAKSARMGLSMIKAAQHDSTFRQRQPRQNRGTVLVKFLALSSVASANTSFPQLELDTPVAF